MELYTDKVVVSPNKGLLNKLAYGFTEGSKSIFLQHITGVAISKANLFHLTGRIKFLTGDVENENVIFDFTANQNEAAVLFKEKLEELKNISYGSVDNKYTSDPDIIRKYKQLFDEGIITQEEFEAKKKEILGI